MVIRKDTVCVHTLKNVVNGGHLTYITNYTDMPWMKPIILHNKFFIANYHVYHCVISNVHIKFIHSRNFFKSSNTIILDLLINPFCPRYIDKNPKCKLTHLYVNKSKPTYHFTTFCISKEKFTWPHFSF